MVLDYRGKRREKKRKSRKLFAIRAKKLGRGPKGLGRQRGGKVKGGVGKGWTIKIRKRR